MQQVGKRYNELCDAMEQQQAEVRAVRGNRAASAEARQRLAGLKAELRETIERAWTPRSGKLIATTVPFVWK